MHAQSDELAGVGNDTKALKPSDEGSRQTQLDLSTPAGPSANDDRAASLNGLDWIGLDWVGLDWIVRHSRVPFLLFACRHASCSCVHNEVHYDAQSGLSRREIQQ